MRKPKLWDHLLWGVTFASAPKATPQLIGSLWHWPMPKKQYVGEPPHAFLFTTRKAARDWCKKQMAEYATRTDQCQDWRFRPVRVRETVRVEP